MDQGETHAPAKAAARCLRTEPTARPGLATYRPQDTLGVAPGVRRDGFAFGWVLDHVERVPGPESSDRGRTLRRHASPPFADGNGGQQLGGIGGLVERAPVAEPVVELGGGDGPGHEVVLCLIAAQTAQLGVGDVGLDAFGHNAQAEAGGLAWAFATLNSISDGLPGIQADANIRQSRPHATPTTAGWPHLDRSGPRP